MEFQMQVKQLYPEDHSELGFAIAKLVENYEDLTNDTIGILGILSHVHFQMSQKMEEAGGPVESGAVTG